MHEININKNVQKYIKLIIALMFETMSTILLSLKAISHFHCGISFSEREPVFLWEQLWYAR